MSLPLLQRVIHQSFAIALPMAMLATASMYAEDYSVVDQSGEHTDIVSPSGKTLLRYMYARDTSSPERAFDTAKVFAHVMDADGKNTITKGAGGKFPHHRGIFIGWNKLRHDGKSHDLWHVRNTEQKHRELLKQTSGPDGASVTAVIDWIGNDGKPVVEEKRTYSVRQEDGTHAIVDFKSELTAIGGDVELNGDPEHAGVQFRPSQQVADNKSAKYIFHEADIDPKKVQDLPWVAEDFQVDDQWWSVQHMSHPDNATGARWSAYRDYGRFGPFTVVTIPEGETVTFQYRFRIQEGKSKPRAKLQQAYEEYIN